MYANVDDMEKATDPIIRQLVTSGYEIPKFLLRVLTSFPEQDILCLLDRPRPFFVNMDTPRLGELRSLLARLCSAGLLWATRTCQMGPHDPSYAPAIGFARTIRTEMLLDFVICELEDWENNAGNLGKVLWKFQAQRKDTNLPKANFEFALHQGQVHVGRYFSLDLPGELSLLSCAGNTALDVGTPGRANTLQSTQAPRELPGEEEVEIKEQASGFNLRVGEVLLSKLLCSYVSNMSSRTLTAHDRTSLLL